MHVLYIEKERGKVVDPSALLVEHDPSGPTASTLIIHMKEDIVSLLLGKQQFTEEFLQERLFLFVLYMSCTNNLVHSFSKNYRCSLNFYSNRIYS